MQIHICQNEGKCEIMSKFELYMSNKNYYGVELWYQSLPWLYEILWEMYPFVNSLQFDLC